MPSWAAYRPRELLGVGEVSRLVRDLKGRSYHRPAGCVHGGDEGADPSGPRNLAENARNPPQPNLPAASAAGRRLSQLPKDQSRGERGDRDHERDHQEHDPCAARGVTKAHATCHGRRERPPRRVPGAQVFDPESASPSCRWRWSFDFPHQRAVDLKGSMAGPNAMQMWALGVARGTRFTGTVTVSSTPQPASRSPRVMTSGPDSTVSVTLGPVFAEAEMRIADVPRGSVPLFSHPVAAPAGMPGVGRRSNSSRRRWAASPRAPRRPLSP